MKVMIAIGVHPRFRRFIDNLPKGFEYEIRGEPDVNKYYNRDRTGGRVIRTLSIRGIAGGAVRILGLPRIKYYKTNADVIYSTRGILPLNRRPWIVETEHPYGFVGMDFKSWGWRQKFITRTLLRSKFCRRIVVVTDAAKKIMEEELKDASINKKITVLYTSVECKKIRRVAHKGITILTISNADIYSRGFTFLKSVYPALKKKYKINWILKTNQLLSTEDQQFIKKYGVELVPGNFNEDQINSLFSRSDIFVNISFVDTNSNVVYEAMRAGLPIVMADVFSGREKINDGYNGFIVPVPPLFWDKDNRRMSNPPDFSKYENPEVSATLQNRLEKLIKDKKLREKMGKRNFALIKNGKFSMEKRVEKLKEILKDAANGG